MPHDAPELKVQATRGYGGEVIVYDRYKENREEVGRKLAQERGMTLIPPYDHPDVIAGQGTAAKELFEETGELDVLLVCLGGGGLLAGCAIAYQAGEHGQVDVSTTDDYANPLALNRHHAVQCGGGGQAASGLDHHLHALGEKLHRRYQLGI